MKTQILLIITMFSFFLLHCNNKSASATTKNDERVAVLEAQTLLWYNGMSSLRDDPDSESKIELLILTNYFPLYLSRRKEMTSDQQFLIVASSFQKMGREKVETSCWALRKQTFPRDLQKSQLGSFGFDPDEISTFEKFQKARSEYFDALEKKTFK